LTIFLTVSSKSESLPLSLAVDSERCSESGTGEILLLSRRLWSINCSDEDSLLLTSEMDSCCFAVAGLQGVEEIGIGMVEEGFGYREVRPADRYSRMIAAKLEK